MGSRQRSRFEAAATDGATRLNMDGAATGMASGDMTPSALLGLHTSIVTAKEMAREAAAAQQNHTRLSQAGTIAGSVEGQHGYYSQAEGTQDATFGGEHQNNLKARLGAVATPTAASGPGKEPQMKGKQPPPQARVPPGPPQASEKPGEAAYPPPVEEGKEEEDL